ncbi:HEAT repeat domain-containing protein [Lusitaniella coriacea LEGE 07157]|uniref:HEAT repeat domain-containing protein n=1 Tax=Lusitaniella coriacea LEGE 07157 TaxID=945747 RepID=A0A8J7DVA1_9CYAN|nr:HEAT repeat domain-containing protein [Lusitaniella coriacea]MBE9115643.1 HEAT repeat domain-containing protein [Lusitaniella coriacea LEGE 07157]
MSINEIKTALESSNFQDRLKALTALRQYEPEVAVPLLLSHVRDREFLVRSFVAMGLGKKQTADSFAALLEMIKFDRDPNVRAEASNSLSLFGQISASHLVQTFLRDDHWLVRRSILAALNELDCPGELFEVCLCGLEGEDQSVKEASIESLSRFANSPQQDAALSYILPLAQDSWWRNRMRAAQALIRFDCPQAKDILAILRKDEHHRVVAAALEAAI